MEIGDRHLFLFPISEFKSGQNGQMNAFYRVLDTSSCILGRCWYSVVHAPELQEFGVAQGSPLGLELGRRSCDARANASPQGDT